jgi:hypothetical protein
MSPFSNATISTTRSGAAVLTNKRVQLDFPTRNERIMAQGGDVPVQLYDLPSANYQQGDVVQVLSIDGHTTVPHPAHYTVGLVERLVAPLALTSVELTGLAGYE